MKVITIGKASNNDVNINEHQIAHNHLQIVQDDKGNFFVVDFNTENGTFVNGQPVKGEVKLNINDTLRAGNIILPWQTYFALNQPAAPSYPVPASYKNHTKMIIWIAASVILVLLLGGGIAFKFIHDEGKREEARIMLQKEEDEKQKVLQLENDRLELERMIADEKLKEEQSRADAAKVTNAEEKLKLLKQAEEYKAKQEKLEKNLSDINNEKKQLEQAKAKAEEDAKKTLAAKDKEAEELKKNAEKEKKEAQNNASNAEKQNELTNEFWGTFHKLLSNEYILVCKQLKQEVKKEDAENYIRNQFLNAPDNERIKEIIKAMNQVINERSATLRPSKDQLKITINDKNKKVANEVMESALKAVIAKYYPDIYINTSLKDIKPQILVLIEKETDVDRLKGMINLLNEKIEHYQQAPPPAPTKPENPEENQTK